MPLHAAIAVDDYFSGHPSEGVHANIVQNDYVSDEYQITASLVQGDGTAEYVGEGYLSFIPAPGFIGTAVISYTLVDADGSDTANVYIEISTNDEPHAVNDFVYAPADYSGGIPIWVLDNDVGFGYNATLTVVSGLSPSAAGTVETQQGESVFFFTPTPGFTGSASFVYQVSEDGFTDTATVTIQVGEGGIADNPLLTEEERRTAEVLQDACSNASGPLSAACQQIDQLPAGEQQQALRQILPSQVSAQINGARLQQGQQASNLRGRLQTLRSGGSGISFSGLSLNLLGSTLPLGQLLDSQLRGGQPQHWNSDRLGFLNQYSGVDTRSAGAPGLVDQLLVLELRQQLSSPHAGVRAMMLASLDPSHYDLAMSMQADEEAPTDDRRSSSDPFANTPWGFFVTGRFNTGDVSSRSSEPGFDFDTLGITAGIDHRLNDKLVVGGAVGFGSTKNDFGDRQGKLDVDSWTLSMYGNYYPMENVYIDWALGYGINDYDGKRRMSFAGFDSEARYNTDGHQYSASLSGGYEWSWQAWQLGPYLRMDYLHSVVDSYRESGGMGLALRIDEQHDRSFETALGLRVSRAISWTGGVLLPSVDVEWVRDWQDGDRHINATLVEAPGSGNFGITTRSLGSRYANIGASLTAVFTGGRFAYLRYETVADRRDIDEYTLQAGFRMEF